MQLYNPFKPHKVYFNSGKYGVRKFTMLNGWEYYDQQGSSIWWSMEEYVKKYCQTTSDKIFIPLDKGERIV